MVQAAPDQTTDLKPNYLIVPITLYLYHERLPLRHRILFSISSLTQILIYTRFYGIYSSP